jgi:hypothetical protein
VKDIRKPTEWKRRGIIEIQIHTKLSWELVKAESGLIYEYPKPRMLSERIHGIPAVYRWCIAKHGADPSSCYIGETDNLFRRVTRNYVSSHPSRSQSHRVAQRLKDAIDEGLSVQLQVLKFDGFQIQGHRIDQPSLSDPFRRKLMENIALLLQDRIECELINEDVSRFGRRLKRVRS